MHKLKGKSSTTQTRQVYSGSEQPSSYVHYPSSPLGISTISPKPEYSRIVLQAHNPNLYTLVFETGLTKETHTRFSQAHLEPLHFGFEKAHQRNLFGFYNRAHQ